MPSSISAENVRKGFSTVTGVLPVLDGIDLSVASGEFVALIGASGSGKSTLLDIFAGFSRPDGGAVTVDGQPIDGPSRRRILIPQKACVFPWMSARRNLNFVQDQVPEAERERLTELYLRMVGLDDFQHAYPRELSGGMLKRLEIARALVVKPDVLLMDEPFGSLDALTRLKLRNELRRLLDVERHTVLLVTHDVDDALHLADRIIVLTPRPARIQRVVELPFPHPRALASIELTTLKNEILTDLGVDTGEPVAARSTTRTPRSVVAQAPALRTTTLDADVIVIGGGPAGAILASYLGRAGVDHMVLDKAVHPRPHVGESLICSTTRVFQDIGFLPVMEREGFIHKHGAVWHNWPDSREHVLRFEAIPHLGVQQDYSYHVDRSRFDALLLDHARGAGSRVVESARVMSVDIGDDGVARGVRVRVGADSERTLRCRIVVDASGRDAVLGSQLKLKRMDPAFDQFALHSWFEGVDRGPAETADYIQLYTLPTARSWLWQIPITPTTTSVGIVARRQDFVAGADRLEEFFLQNIATLPDLARRMAGRRQLQPFVRTGNYSYVMNRFAGDGWLLLGDAARFVDPIFSSGISVAAESARLAATAVTASLQSGDTSAAAFATYEETIRAGLDRWRTFILCFYELPPLFLDLLDSEAGRAGLRPLVQGEVYETRSIPVLDRMLEIIDAVRADPDHPWRDQLAPLSGVPPRDRLATGVSTEVELAGVNR
jgi:1H-pyrrole-2-carbonyl-[peptidyl-carrier protein] chlorinase